MILSRPKKNTSEVVMNCIHSLWQIRFSETGSSNGGLLGHFQLRDLYVWFTIICDTCSWILSARMSAQHHTQVLTLMTLVFEQVVLCTSYNDSLGKVQFYIEFMDGRSCVNILGHCGVMLGVNQQFHVVVFLSLPPLLSPVIT